MQLEVLPTEHVVVDLSGATVTSFVDTAGSWPTVLQLDRMTYEALRPLLPARERLKWLQRNQNSDSPQPYVQLARQYRDAGHDHDARTVLLAKYRYRNRRQPLPFRLWGFLQDLTVGYGYRPGRALGWLVALVLTVIACAAIWPPVPTASSAPEFNATIYALDVALPILDLGQERAYRPVGPGQIIEWIAILSGWLLATTVIAAITRVTNRP